MDDLLEYAESMGCRVGKANLGGQALFVAGEGLEPPVILLPPGNGLLVTWLLAHELGHLVFHAGPRGALSYSKDETKASRWAASALIPNARIQSYLNACEDSMIAALSAHFEDIPMTDCPVRRLAGRIAQIRLQTLSMEVA